MWIQQVFAALLCVLFVSHDIKAVVNNAQANVKSENESNSTKSNENADDSSNLNNVADSVASSSDPEANRRDAPLSISDSYEAPLGDTYLPPEPSNIGLPQPVYGVPNAPTNNIVYPAPPPDIPPPLPSKPVLFNPAGDFNTYGPPKENNIHLKENFRPPPLPPLKYGPPSLHQRLPKPFPPFPFNHQKGPKQHFAPSLQSKPHFKPKPLYGPPKIQFRPPKPPKSNYGPPKFVNSFGLSPPKGNYGPPKFNQGIRYGPPDPVPHGPPHPGAPAPPTPPDIKYDGWQPIPGLVSRPPSSTYGVPNNNHAVHGDLQLNADFSPPHLDTSYNSFGSAISQQSLFLGGNGGFPADSYGAPLNAVTGSGDLISDQGHEEHPGLSIGLASVGLGNNHDDSLSVVKSIGYEIYLNNNGGFGDAGVGHAVQDTYSAPPLNSYSPDGPYAAAHSYNSNGVSFDSNLNSHSGLSLSSSGIGLIPPSGVYGVPPSGSYGTPLLGSVQQHGHALNALEINPPKHPVIFREPVPNGLIESIGNHVAQKDAHGIIEHSSSYTGGPTYIPPPVPDLTKPVNEDHLPEPSNLFSLPANDAPVSFQNVVHDTSVASSGLGSYATNLGHHSDASALASFGVPFSTIDGSYGETVALDTSHAATSIDLTSLPLSYGVPTIGNYHDCSLHKSQPLPLPQLSYGVPSANSYTASLSSLTTNIGGLQNHHHQDLQAAHSQKQSVAANVIGQSQVKDSYGKALIKNNLDLNNIPIQGALGSYTLQIQPADSLGSSSSPHVPHEQLLNDGLLRSILAAIENPRQKLQQQQQQQQQQQLQQLQQQQLQLQPQLQQQQYVELQQPPSQAEEIEAQDSAKNLVVVTPSPDNELVNAHKNDSNEVELDENEIALYFNNSQNKRNSDESVISEESSKDSSDKVLNGQQYGGSFVSFKTPKSSFSYGDLNMAQKDAEVKT